MSKRRVVGRITRQCETCGADVTRKASAFKAHTFCSVTCYTSSEYHAEATRVHTQARYPDGRVSAACLNCGTLVERARSQVGPRTFCSRECKRQLATSARLPQATSSGYVRVFVGRGHPGATKSGHIFEHRLVMQERLGRPLLASENVHHINGVRADNRPENLELWSTWQPPGQRVADKLAWARQFIEIYAREEF